MVASGTLFTLALIDDACPERSRALVATGAFAGPFVGLPMYLWLRANHGRTGDRDARSAGGGPAVRLVARVTAPRRGDGASRPSPRR